MKGLIHSDFMYVNIEPYKSNFFYTTIKCWKSLPCTIIDDQCYPYIQGRIYYEANEASASGPHHLGGPHQNFNAVSKVDFFYCVKNL